MVSGSRSGKAAAPSAPASSPRSERRTNMIGLIGRKVGMTQIHGEKGEVLPITVIEAGPCTVTEVRTAERNGYVSVQLGFGTNKEIRFKKPVLGQFQKRNLPPS